MFDGSALSSLLFSLSNSLRTGNILLDFVLLGLLAKIFTNLPKIGEYIEAKIDKFVSRWRFKHEYTHKICIKYDKVSVSGNVGDLSVNDDNKIIINGILAHLKANNAIKCSSEQELINICHYTGLLSDKECLIDSQLLEYPIHEILYDGMLFDFSMEHKIKSEERTSNIIANNIISIRTNNYEKTIQFIEQCKKDQIEREFKNHGDVDDSKMYYYYFYKRAEKDELHPLLFKNKEKVLATIDDFVNKRGAWDPMKQRPYKLFIFLYGPPGTGKTSFAKALCNKLQRSPVKLSLDKCSTNEELLDLFCYPTLHLIQSRYDDETIRLPIAKRLNILEDMDCDKLNHLIAPRDGTNTIREQSAQIEEKKSSSLKDGKDEKSDDDSDEERYNQDKQDNKEDETRKQKSISKFTEINKVAIPDKAEIAAKIAETFKDTFKAGISDVTLSGLLNTFDGLYELTDCVSLISTNDIEKFDKALIRPGRMDLIIHMDYLKHCNLLKLMDIYYKDSVNIDLLPRANIWDSKKITPSDVEPLFQLHKTFDEIVSALQHLMAKTE